MNTLTYKSLREKVGIDFLEVKIPEEPVRRIGAGEYKEKIFSDFNKSLNSIDQAFNESIIDISGVQKFLETLINEFASNIYALGSAHEVWKHWSALGAFGLFLCGNLERAAEFAVLSGEWEFVKVLPNFTINTLQKSDIVTWALITHNLNFEIGSPNDSYEAAWINLMQSIPARDHITTEQSLKAISSYWMEETGNEWKQFLYGRHPTFHTSACVVAAIARSQGFVPSSLTRDQYDFLEAGLSVSEPDNMFPSVFSLA